MMMTIRTPAMRRRRRLSMMILTGGLTLLAGGAWAATAASGRYRLVLVDGQTGKVVSASPATETRLVAGPVDGPDWKLLATEAASAAVDGATALLNAIADRLESGQAPAVPLTTDLSGMSVPVAEKIADRLTIQVIDAWANPGSLEPMPVAALLGPAETFGLVPPQ